MDVQPKGVFCAALTPLDADLAPDHAVFAKHCRYLLSEGCDGIALLGTTGEANSFSGSERRALIESVVRAGIAPSQLLPGTGVPALTETVELTRHALSLGVTTVVMLPPFYYKDITDEGLTPPIARSFSASPIRALRSCSITFRRCRISRSRTR
jgi:4-hydroxy-tetrahydrodipicolinate synthase